MKDIKILGVDIAKDVFQLCGIDEWGKVIYTRRVKRAQYVSTVASLKVGCVVMEILKYWVLILQKMFFNCVELMSGVK